MKNRIIALFITGAMAVTLVACGKAETPAVEEPVDTVAEETVEEVADEAEEVVEEATEEEPEEAIETEEVTRLKTRKKMRTDRSDAIETIEYEYNEMNQLISMGDDEIKEYYEYDDLGRLVRSYKTNPVWGNKDDNNISSYIDYAYDENGNNISEREYVYSEYSDSDDGYDLNDNNVYTYDDQNRRVSSTWYAYFEAEESDGGWEYLYEYNDYGKICKITSQDSVSKKVYEVQENEFDENGNITLEWEDGSSINYVYTYDDNGNRITSVKSGMGYMDWDDEVYDYCAYETYEYDSDNRLVKTTHEEKCVDGEIHDFEDNYSYVYEYETVEIPVDKLIKTDDAQ